MTQCKKCGEPISFKQLPNGSWCPMNLDGSYHLKLCKRVRRKNQKPEISKGVMTQLTMDLHIPLYSGDAPPWD